MSDSQTKPAASTPPRARPLSPHLQIYRLPLAAITSISHRASGVALCVGAVVLVAWLFAAATNAEYFAWWQSTLKTPVGLFCMAGWSLALFYHLCAGLRHLIWDAGIGLEKQNVNITNLLVIAAALAMTAVTWVAVLPKLHLPV